MMCFHYRQLIVTFFICSRDVKCQIRLLSLYGDVNIHIICSIKTPFCIVFVPQNNKNERNCLQTTLSINNIKCKQREIKIKNVYYNGLSVYRNKCLTKENTRESTAFVSFNFLFHPYLS